MDWWSSTDSKVRQKCASPWLNINKNTNTVVCLLREFICSKQTLQLYHFSEYIFYPVIPLGGAMGLLIRLQSAISSQEALILTNSDIWDIHLYLSCRELIEQNGIIQNRKILFCILFLTTLAGTHCLKYKCTAVSVYPYRSHLKFCQLSLVTFQTPLKNFISRKKKKQDWISVVFECQC